MIVVVLASGLRSELERAVGAGRVVVEAAAAAAVTRLGIAVKPAPAYLSEVERELRRGLRARARQLGDSVDSGADVPLLVAEVAYEQWHRILFARFLEANGLLMHPEYGASVTLEECGEFAAALGEPDAWSVAARFASEILPGVFRTDDPSVRVRLAPEDLLALERVVEGLPEETFLAEDSLGWVYQFWQSNRKKAVNESGRKIGGADISPVTQLFTEDYMVRFLLENSLGAWWAGRYPESPLLIGYEFLRFNEDGAPAAGTFDGWPDWVSEVTIMDPCCGSGHFLIAAFGMLWRMRAEEEGLSPVAAQDAVLRDNLFGLELDARCTQIAIFALALEAWKQGGYRELPVPNVACSGIPAKAPLVEWTKLAKGDYKLEAALSRLYELFKDADTLGSLIEPVRAAEQAGLESVDWDSVAPLVSAALEGEAKKSGDPAAEVFGHAAAGIARAAQLLSKRFTLIATNPPYLGANRQAPNVSAFLESHFPEGKWDLATSMLIRFASMLVPHGVTAAVTPNAWTSIHSYRVFRGWVLENTQLSLAGRLGAGAFRMVTGEVVQVVLTIWADEPAESAAASMLDASGAKSIESKVDHLKRHSFANVDLSAMAKGPGSRLLFATPTPGPLLSQYAESYWGIGTGDGIRFARFIWEIPGSPDDRWTRYQGAFSGTEHFVGRDQVLIWERGSGPITRLAQVLKNRPARGSKAWGRDGIAVNQTGNLDATLYKGHIFQNGVAAVVPNDPADLAAIWCYLSTSEYRKQVRRLDTKVGVTNRTLVQVPFDIQRWRAVAAEKYPDGLPKPWSDDPTQWLFSGVPFGSKEPLQVAVARLVGFQWPDQEPDVVDRLGDEDGIVCLPPVSGEQGAAERVRAVLAVSYGADWSNSRLDELLIAADGAAGDLEGWLRDKFFKHHTRVFQNRPFIWHVWDGRADGFSALVNYHRLNRQTLEKLTYTTLGWWIDRQKADASNEVAGAAQRLAAAQALQAKLALILEGEPPYDIFVRWKSLAEHSIGWDPDLDDGVRMNIRPFVEAKVLRSSFTINWRKDRGKNPDGTERLNDLHFTREQKQPAR